ncbi:unnamed protein product [Phaeothamnion confervicola]
MWRTRLLLSSVMIAARLASAVPPIFNVGVDDPSNSLCDPPGEADLRSLCELSTASSGRWIPTTITPIPPGYGGAPDADYQTDCDGKWAAGHDVSVTGPRPLWHWCPDSCHLPAFHPQLFCYAAHQRNVTGVLTVGDSLNRLFSTTLATALSAERLQHQNDEIEHGGEAYLACGGALRLKFVRNDILRVDDSDTSECHDICQQFLPYLEADQGYNAVVVNSGAHYLEDSAYIAHMMAAADVISAGMREAHPDGSSFMMFRNTVPGSPYCDMFKFSPPLEPFVAESRIADRWATNDWPYHWEMFKRHNDLAEPIFAGKGFTVMDAYTPTVQRFDSHQGGFDCLHYCIPGPIDHWIRLLQLALLA